MGTGIQRLLASPLTGDSAREEVSGGNGALIGEALGVLTGSLEGLGLGLGAGSARKGGGAGKWGVGTARGTGEAHDTSKPTMAVQYAAR
jgi:hypothetical protein